MITLNEPRPVKNAKNAESFLNAEELLYARSNVIIRRSFLSDWFKLKKSDRLEVYLASGVNPSDALEKSLEETLIGFTVLINYKPEISFGITAPCLMGNEAVIWMLSSDKINDIGVRFIRNNRRYIDYFLTYYKRLVNYVHVDNTSSIKWLKYLGARFDEPLPYGIHNRMFMKFTFKR